MKFLSWLYEFFFGPRWHPPVALLSHPLREAQESAARSIRRFDQTISFMAEQAEDMNIDPDPIEERKHEPVRALHH